jgi:iron-sulfur cluster repair protein YtfE (RIC family)
MAGLIQELKEQHTQLLSILQLAKTNGFATPETRELLRSARTGLLDHLRKEDLELYPVLQTAALKNPSIKDTLDTFTKDMAETSKLAIGFFKKCDQGGTDHDLSKEFGLLLAKLRSRIRREEDLLYPLYDQIATKKAA